MKTAEIEKWFYDNIDKYGHVPDMGEPNYGLVEIGVARAEEMLEDIVRDTLTELRREVEAWDVEYIPVQQVLDLIDAKLKNV